MISNTTGIFAAAATAAVAWKGTRVTLAVVSRDGMVAQGLVHNTCCKSCVSSGLELVAGVERRTGECGAPWEHLMQGLQATTQNSYYTCPGAANM